MKKIIALDTEGAGPRLGFHPTLSIGAAVVLRETMNFEQRQKEGLVFYTELKPSSLEYYEPGMRVGALHLECIEELRKKNECFDPNHNAFDSRKVLLHMQEVCEEPAHAYARFIRWIDEVSENQEVIGLTDTVFFDGGHVHLGFGLNHSEMSPFGWKGLDLNSVYKGFMVNPHARFSRLGPEFPCAKEHKADHDAVDLAGFAKKVLYDQMHWHHFEK